MNLHVKWNDCPTWQKRGIAVVKKIMEKFFTTPDGKTAIVPRSAWVVDGEMPILTKDRKYVYSLLPARTDNSDALLPEKNWREIINEADDTAKP